MNTIKTPLLLKKKKKKKKKGKEVTFEPDFYYSQVNIGKGGPISSASVHTSHFC